MAVSVGPPLPTGQVVITKTFDAATVGTVPAGTMVALTRTGTIIDRVGPTPVINSLTTLSASTTGSEYACDMGSQTFVVGYVDTTNSSSITLIACSVSGSTISAGSPVVVSASTSTNFHICRLSDTLGVVVYTDTTNSSTQTAKAFSLSGTTITVGAAQTTSTSTNTAGSFSLWRSSATTFLLVFNDSANSSRLSVVAGSVSGTTVSVGAKVQVSTTTTNASLSNIAVLTSTSFAIVFNDGINSNHTSFVAGSLSTNTITLGSIVQDASGVASAQFTHFTGVLDSTHFVALGQATSTNSVSIWIVNVVGTVISVGSAITNSFTYANSTGPRDVPNLNIGVVDSTHAYLWLGGYVTVTGDTSGTLSTTGFNGTGATNSHGLFLSSGLAFGTALNPTSATFSGGTGSYSQVYTTVSGTFSFSVAINNSVTRAIFVASQSGVGVVARIIEVYGPGNPGVMGVIGVTSAAGTAGQTVPVVVLGYVGGLSGLTQKSAVSAMGNGVLNTSALGLQTAVALALDSSSILLEANFATSSTPQTLLNF